MPLSFLVEGADVIHTFSKGLSPEEARLLPGFFVYKDLKTEPMTEKTERHGKLLVCEDYPPMREAFELTLGSYYELVFADSPERIIHLLRREPFRLLIWDIDPADGRLEKALKAISTDSPLEVPSQKQHLEVLEGIRRSFPDLMILLIAGEFEYDFQVRAIQQCGLIRFIIKPWKSSEYFAEQVQVMLGDRESSIRDWVLRVPIEAKSDA